LHVFSKSPGGIGRTYLTQHFIDTGNAKPIHQRPYRFASFKRNEILRQSDEMLQIDLTVHSNSPWASLVVLIKKPRVCCDFRKVNTVTKKDSYRVMRIDDALDRLKGTTRFLITDCNQAFYQVEMNETDRD